MRAEKFNQLSESNLLPSAMFPDIPQRSKAFQASEKSKTNPNSAAKPDSKALLSLAVDRAIGAALTDKHTQPPPDLPACSTACQGVPQRSQTFQTSEKCETNPNSPDTTVGDELTPRQRVAARLLMQGLKSDAIASQLQTTRQTINRWRHLPGMVAELKRLQDMLSRDLPIRADSARQENPSEPTPPTHRSKDQEFDIWRTMEQYGFRRPSKPAQ